MTHFKIVNFRVNDIPFGSSDTGDIHNALLLAKGIDDNLGLLFHPQEEDSDVASISICKNKGQYWESVKDDYYINIEDPATIKYYMNLFNIAYKIHNKNSKKKSTTNIGTVIDRFYSKDKKQKKLNIGKRRMDADYSLFDYESDNAANALWEISSTDYDSER